MPPVDSRVGDMLVRVVVGAGLWVIGLSLVAAVLSGIGWWVPWVGWTVAVALAVLAARAMAWLPVGPTRPHGGAVRAGHASALALVAVVIAFGVWAGATHAEQLLPRRDAASNLQAAISLATTHERVVAIDAAAVGGPDVLALPGITLASPAFYAVGGSADPAIQPQFVIGPAAAYGLGVWAGGVGVALVLPALAAAVGLLAVGLLVSRTLGGWWGVAAAAITGLAFPIVHVARATYSEPLSLITLGGGLLGLLLAADGDVDDDGVSSSRWALVAGVLVGGTALVRIDGLRETILLLVVAGLALAQGRRWARPLLVGAGVSTAAAFAIALWLSNQYLGTIARSLVPLVGIGVAVAVLTWAGLALRRRGVGLPDRYAARLPFALAALTALVLAVLASRPAWLVVRQDPADPGSRYVAGMQARQGLPIDGGRTYAEQSVAWLDWYLGPVTLVLAAVALVVLVHRAAGRWSRGEVLPGWVAPGLVVVGSTLMTLWRPGITPDHPWADRRLVIAIPTVVVLALTALTALTSLAARPIPRPTPSSVTKSPGKTVNPGRFGLSRRGGVALGVLLAVAAPTVAATWPHAAARVERGELAAVEQACAALDDRDVVLAVDSRAAQEWVQVVRGQCGVPALATTAALRKDAKALASTVARVRTAVAGAGGRLVLLSADDTPADSLQELAGSWTTATSVVVLEDQHVLERRPDGLDPLRITVRLAVPTGP
jgi:hypothetical protein